MAGAPDFIPNFRNVQELLAGFYGSAFLSEPQESDYTIGTGAVELGVRRGQRIGLICSNTGSTNIAIAYNNGVTITTGFLLLPGGVFRSDWYYDGDLLTVPLYAISSAAGGTLHMMERLLAGA